MVANSAVWSYAAALNLVIVSKDSDFQYRALLLGHPRIGEVKKADFVRVISR